LLELVLRVTFSLLVVFGLLWGLARLVRRGGVGRGGAGRVAVLHRTSLTRGSWVTVVRVADRALVLGVTDTHVSLLSETDLDAFESVPKAAPDDTPDAPAVRPDDVLPPAHPFVLPHHGGKLDGSVLSPRTWSSTLDYLRDRTARH
jgi:flagellar protein FliO/FliZ